MKTWGAPKIFWYGPFGDVLPKRPYTFYENLVPFRPINFFDFPIIGPKKKRQNFMDFYLWIKGRPILSPHDHDHETRISG